VATISLEGVSKVYRNGTEAVKDLDLEVGEGEFMVLVGPSGCGKTTALRMVAGLEDITSGTMRIGDRIVNGVSPKDRDVAMVFQNYALYPHMTVKENIGFALKLRKVQRREAKQRVLDAADVLGLTAFLDRKPGQLSGGQRQRVAMGRAIVRDPLAFLMDEPLSNLDAKLRVQMRAEILRTQRRVGVATLYVTHDQVEAMTMGDRVAVMGSGVLQQCAAPQEVYDAPVNVFVAAFIGSPAMNLYEARVVDDAGTLAVELGRQRLQLDEGWLEGRPGLRGYVNQQVVVGFRPEALTPVSPESTGQTLRVRVELVEALGPELLVHFSVEARRVRPEGAGYEEDGSEALVTSGVPAEARADGIARASSHASIVPGEEMTLSADCRHLHAFDPASGLAIR
jgi:multiple sugar transport system ATP-binding protein